MLALILNLLYTYIHYHCLRTVTFFGRWGKGTCHWEEPKVPTNVWQVEKKSTCLHYRAAY